MEATLSTVRKGHVTSALTVNTADASVPIKRGVFLGEGLVYDREVVPEPLEFPIACLASVQTSADDIELVQGPSLSSRVNEVDYPELKHSLLGLLGRYREAIALPGEPLGVIQHSRFPWNSSIFLVPKRPVIDFRKLSEVTTDDRFPLPVLKDLLLSLGQGNKIFTSLDLLSGYWQVPMAESSREITAFSTREGYYEWFRMPFGLKNAPLNFQKIMNTLFSDTLRKQVFIYLDDILVCSQDSESHFAALEAVFKQPKDAGLKVKLTKRKFLKEKVSFLEHTIDGEGTHTMDNKVLATKNFPQPKSIDNVRSFLGLARYYRSFIKNFAAIASPLTWLLKKDVFFHWDATQEKSFQELKLALTHVLVLVHISQL